MKKANFDNFSSKLRSSATIESLRQYIRWYRLNEGLSFQSEKHEANIKGPVSINLDITVACNYSCDHCVDSKMLNSGESFSFSEICCLLDVMRENGLKSVILIGGGEPTLHPAFEKIVRRIKSLSLQLGIVTNGSNVERLVSVADCLVEHDWVRFSLDAAENELFLKIHKPKKRITLDQICSRVRLIRARSRKVTLGFSYIIIWEGCRVGDVMLSTNVHQIPIATQLAAESGFDYISFKPCLVKDDSSDNHETLLFNEDESGIQGICESIAKELDKAVDIAGDRIRVVQSINLRAMLSRDLGHYYRQTVRCHSQIFRQIVTPVGVYTCPAYRGDSKALIADRNGCLDQSSFSAMLDSNKTHLLSFNALAECKNIACFYNDLNWWIERYIHSGDDVDIIPEDSTENYFL